MALSNWALFCIDEKGNTYTDVDIEGNKISLKPYKSWIQIWDIPKKDYTYGTITEGNLSIDGLSIKVKTKNDPEGIFFKIEKKGKKKEETKTYWGIACYGYDYIENEEVIEKSKDAEWIFQNTTYNTQPKECFIEFHKEMGAEFFEEEVARALEIETTEWVSVKPLYDEFITWAKKEDMDLEEIPTPDKAVNIGTVFLVKKGIGDIPKVLPKDEENKYNFSLLSEMIKREAKK